MEAEEGAGKEEGGKEERGKEERGKEERGKEEREEGGEREKERRILARSEERLQIKTRFYSREKNILSPPI